MIREVDTRDATFIRGEPERQDEIATVARQMSNARGMPELVVARLNPGTATVAELRCSGEWSSHQAPLAVAAQDCVQATRAALGSDPEDVVEFSADPVVQRTTSGAAIVHLRQMFRGIPVFQMTRTVTFAPDGRVTKVKGDHAPLRAALDTVPVVDAVRAVRAAGAFVTEPHEGAALGQPSLPEEWTPKVVAAFALPSQPTVLDAEPFVGLTPAHLVVFYEGPTARLGWSIQLTFPHIESSVGAQCTVVVSADKGDADVLFCRRTAHPAVEGEVFERDPVRTPRARIAFPVPAAAYRLPVPPQTNFPKDWCASDATDGRNARAISEQTRQPARATSIGSNVLFVSPDDDSDAQYLINAFYFCNYLHDFFELLGFDARAGNFEAGSTTATGAQGDPVLVIIHSRPLLGFAYMTPRPDGRSPTLGLGYHPKSKRHSALDFTVVAHEYAHGVTQRLVGGPGDGSALAQPQSAGLAEGISDVLSLSIANFSRAEGQPELQVIGEWFTDSPGGLRRRRYDAAYQGTYGLLGTEEYREPHDIGELWCATMMEVVRRWCTKFGSDAYTLCWRVLLDALKIANSPPSLLDARDALEEALDLLRETGETSENDHTVARRLLWEAFAQFGMGFEATTNGPSLHGIVESKRIPPRLAPSS